jgi:hypothetical protein
MPGTPILFDIPEIEIKIAEMRLQLVNKPLIMSGIFIENKTDARYFPLIMSGFGPGSHPTQPACRRSDAPTILTVYPGFQNL